MGSTTLTYNDPKNLDGEPAEVAKAAGRQAERFLRASQRAVVDAELLARNAWMSRQLEAGEDPTPEDWPNSDEGATWGALLRVVGALPAQAAALTLKVGQG